MYLKIEITGENIKKITELRKSGVNLTEYLNQLLDNNDVLLTLKKANHHDIMQLNNW